MDICWRKSVRRQCCFLGSQCGGIVVLGCRSRLWSCDHMVLYKYVYYYLWVRASSSVLWRCWLGGRKGIQPVKTEWWVLAWLSVWSEVQTCIWPSWCHCYLLSLASVKSRLVLPFWYRLTRVVPEKGPFNGCVCVRACVCVCILYGGRQLPVPLYSTVNPSNVNWQLTSEVLHWVHQRVAARCSDCRFVIVLLSRRFCAVCIRILARRKFCSCSKRSIRSHI